MSSHCGPHGKDNLYLLGGFLQAMRDHFEGYIFFDQNELSQLIRGAGPRQYINSTTFESRNGNFSGFTYDILDPLDDFTTALDELCLRYAIKEIPADRQQNTFFVDRGGEYRSASLALIKTPMSKGQTITLSESTIVAVYRVHYAYTAAALGVTVAASLAISLLVAGWRLLGRQFSMSPLEIAKAFNAPLLESTRSNATVAEMVKELRPSLRVRYGEVRQDPLPASQGVPREHREHDEGDLLMTGEEDSGASKRVRRVRLAVDVAERVSTSRNGEQYS